MNIQLIEQDGFRLVGQISETMHTVDWQAVQLTLDRSVVLRVLKPESAGNENIRQWFLRTAQRIARIKSDNLAGVYDIRSCGELHYAVMEFVDGPTVGEVIAHHNGISQKQLLKIAIGIAQGIGQLWSNARIIHRNIKGSTIRLCKSGSVKLTDFSLAISCDDGPGAYSIDEGHIVGTPGFISPELIQGSGELTTQADMYGLGALCFHMATGTMPFEWLEPEAVLTAQGQETLEPMHLKNSSCSPLLSLVVRQLMMHDPTGRYAGWEEVAADLRAVARDEFPPGVKIESELLSTISYFEYDPTTAKPTPRVRLRRGQAERSLGRSMVDEHSAEVRAAEKFKQGVMWLTLVVWLVLLFYLRAVYEPYKNREQEQQSLANAATTMAAGVVKEGVGIEDFILPDSNKAPNNATEPNEVTTGEEVGTTSTMLPMTPGTPAQTDDPSLPELSESLCNGVATLLADGRIATALTLLKQGEERFKERDAMIALLEQVPEPKELLISFLRANVGRTLVLEHQGKVREIIPRSVTESSVHLEANGRGVELPLNQLAADTQLRWLEQPTEPPELVAYCLILMHSTRAGEVRSVARRCEPLSRVLEATAKLVQAREK